MARAGGVCFVPSRSSGCTRLARLLEPLDVPYAAAECVLRPALVDLAGPQEGFAVTLYVKALGTDAAHAYEQLGAWLWRR